MHQRQCLARNTLKLDYDAYYRDVRSLREKGNPNLAKLAKKEAKLAEAEGKLDAFNEQLFERIRALLLERDARLLPQLRQVCGTKEGNNLSRCVVGGVVGAGCLPECVSFPDRVSASDNTHGHCSATYVFRHGRHWWWWWCDGFQFQALERAFFIAVSRKLSEIPEFPATAPTAGAGAGAGTTAVGTSASSSCVQHLVPMLAACSSLPGDPQVTLTAR